MIVSTEFLVERGSGKLPHLRLEMADGGRIMITSGQNPLLCAKVAQGWLGFDVILAGFSSPGVIPPLPARVARAISMDQTITQNEGQLARWSHWFLNQLRVSPCSPLYSGTWILHNSTWFANPILERPVTANTVEAALIKPNPSSFVSWGYDGSGEILPLRILFSAKNARVKAYRRLCREGSLPPILLWWVSGLDSYVILDGHDRLVAAILEAVVPQFIVLERADQEKEQHAQHELIASYAKTMNALNAALSRGGDSRGIHQAQSSASVSLAKQLSKPMVSPTWAWPLPEGKTGWNKAAAAIDSSWLTSLGHSQDCNAE